MEHLYAPWRSDFVAQSGNTDGVCFFCHHCNEKNDKKNLILARNKYTFTLLNLFPYNDGHLLVAPYRHVATPSSLSKGEWNELHEAGRQGIEALEKAYAPVGFNVGMNLGKTAGAGVAAHLHLHVVPRWNGDTNFLPIIGNTKLINQDLKTVYVKLKKYFLK